MSYKITIRACDLEKAQDTGIWPENVGIRLYQFFRKNESAVSNNKKTPNVSARQSKSRPGGRSKVSQNREQSNVYIPNNRNNNIISAGNNNPGLSDGVFSEHFRPMSNIGNRASPRAEFSWNNSVLPSTSNVWTNGFNSPGQIQNPLSGSQPVRETFWSQPILANHVQNGMNTQHLFSPQGLSQQHPTSNAQNTLGGRKRVHYQTPLTRNDTTHSV